MTTGIDTGVDSPAPGRQSPVSLSGRTQAVGTVPGFSSWGMVLFGSPFVGIGIWVSLMGLGVIPVEAANVHAPMWILAVFGLVFAVAGIMIWGMAWAQVARERRRKQNALLHPSEPAMEDYAWDATGYSPKRWKPVLQGLGGAVFMTVFLSIFNWWAFVSDDGPMMVKIIVGIFDLVLIFVWWNAIKTLICALKFGKTRLVYQQFPFHPGDWFQARVELPAGLERVERARLVFRCVREFYVVRGRGKNRSRQLMHEQIWAEEQVLSEAEIGQWPRFLNATFIVPRQEMAPGSCMTSDEPFFWELEMELAVPGVDLKQRYLVPVYGRKEGPEKDVASATPDES